MANIDLKQNEGVRVTNRPNGGNTYDFGGVYAGMSAMDRANDNLARGMQHLGGVLAGISLDMAQTRNNLQFKEGQTYIFGLEEADNKAIEQEIIAGKILDENQLRERYDELHTKRTDAIQKYISDNISSSVVADNLGVWEKQSSVKSFAALGGRWLSLDMQRSGDIARKGIDERIANLDKAGAYSYVDTMEKYWSPQLRSEYKKDIDRRISINKIEQEKLNITTNLLGDQYVSACKSLSEDVISGEYDALTTMDTATMLASIHKLSEQGTARAENQTNKQKREEITKIEGEQAEVQWSGNRDKLIKSAKDMRAQIMASKDFNEAEKKREIGKINAWEKQSLQDYEKIAKQVEVEIAKPYKENLANLVDAAIKSTEAKVDISADMGIFEGVFDNKILRATSAETEASDFRAISQKISTIDFKKDDPHGIKAAELAKIINNQVPNSEYRRSLFQKLAYKLGDNNYEGAYGIKNGRLNQILESQFPTAVKKEKEDLGYAAFLDRVRDRLGVYGNGEAESSKALYNDRDIGMLFEKDPVLAALKSDYDGRQTLLGLAIKKVGKNDLRAANEYSQAVDRFAATKESEIFNLDYDFSKIEESRSKLEETFFKTIKLENLKQ